MGGKQQAVVDVKALRVGGAVLPGFDMACAEQARFSDVNDGASPTPVVHESVSENVLPDALHDEPFDLGCLGQIVGPGFKFPERLDR